MYKIKPFEKLTFHDDFMFGLIMQDKEICREALECLLGISIDRLEYIEPQKTIVPVYTAHGIRLDVYVDDGKKVYDVEIQNRDEHDIGKRTRYYQGIMDTEALLKGADYDELKESIIIFLCRFDPFKKGIPWYTVRRTCLEEADVSIDDGAVVKMFNCTAYDRVENESLRAFLKYVQNNNAESDFTRRISGMVEAQKEMEATKKLYFSWSLHDHDVRKHGREEGRKEGIRIGEKRGEKRGIAVGKEQGMNEAKIASARNMLSMKLGTHEQIAQAVGLPLEEIEELAAELK